MSPYLEQLARTLFEQAEDALFLLDAGGQQIIDANAAAEQLTGRDRHTLRQNLICRLLASKEGEVVPHLQQALSAPESLPAFDGWFLPSPGQKAAVPVRVQARRLNVEPRPLLLLTARDLREQRHAQVLLEEARAELQRVMASVSDYLWSAEVDGAGRWRYRYVSPVVLKLTGRPPEYYLPDPLRWLSTIHPEDRPRMEQQLHRVWAGQLSHFEEEYRVVWPDGKVRWLRDSLMVTRGDGVLHLDGVAADITERRERETALRETNEALRKLLQASPLAIYTIDLQGIVRSWNPACQQVFGWSEEEVLGKALPTIPAAQITETRNRIERILAGESFTAREVQRVRKDGTTLDVALSAAPLYDASGKANGILSLVADITERRQALRALRQAEAKYHNIFEHAVEGIYQTAVDGRFLIANPMLARIYGYPSAAAIVDDVSLRTNHLYVQPGRREEFLRQILEHSAVAGFESQIRRKDGQVVWVSENARTVRNDSGEVLYFEGTVVDISERKQAEEALAKEHALLRSLLNSIPDLIALKDVHGVYRGCNAAFERYLGRSEHDVIGRTDLDLFPHAIGSERQKTDRQALSEQRLLRS
jgi:PAS domain S-box-containing protein